MSLLLCHVAKKNLLNNRMRENITRRRKKKLQANNVECPKVLLNKTLCIRDEQPTNQPNKQCQISVRNIYFIYYSL